MLMKWGDNVKERIVFFALTAIVFISLLKVLAFIWNRLSIPVTGITNVLSVFITFMLIPLSLFVVNWLIRVMRGDS